MFLSTKKIQVLFLLLFIAQSAFSQSNLQAFTPSVLLQKGQLEINIFNSLYSQKHGRDHNGNKFSIGQRESFLKNTFSFLYGISENRRLNIGLETNFASSRYTYPNNSIFSFFGNEVGDFKKALLSSIGPKIKFTPFKQVSFLSVQSTLLFPLSDDLESPRFTDHNRVNWITQVFFDKALTEEIRIFLEVGLLYRFKNLVAHNDFFRIPMSAILSYFPSSKATLFTSLQHAPAFGKVVSDSFSKFGQIRWFTALGVGVKYQATNNLGLEISYSNFILSRNDGAGSTINIGIRIIK